MGGALSLLYRITCPEGQLVLGPSVRGGGGGGTGSDIIPASCLHWDY